MAVGFQLSTGAKSWELADKGFESWTQLGIITKRIIAVSLNAGLSPGRMKDYQGETGKCQEEEKREEGAYCAAFPKKERT